MPANCDANDFIAVVHLRQQLKGYLWTHPNVQLLEGYPEAVREGLAARPNAANVSMSGRSKYSSPLPGLATVAEWRCCLGVAPVMSRPMLE